MPGEKQAWPKRALCWSPAMPATGMPSGRKPTLRVTPYTSLESATLGRQAIGTRNRSHISSLQHMSFRSYRSVREALEGSVTCAPVRRQVR